MSSQYNQHEYQYLAPVPHVIARRQFIALSAALFLPQPIVAQKRHKLSHAWPKGSVVDRSARLFSDLISKEFGTSFEVFPKRELMGSVEGYNALSAGSIDAWIGPAVAVPGTLSGALRVFDVPFLIRNEDHLKRVFTTGIDSPLSRAVEQAGLMLIAPISIGAHAISSNGAPIREPSDLKGVKIGVRGGGGITQRMFSEFGASAHYVKYGEIYAASQAGFFDAFAGRIEFMDRLKLFETHQNVSLTRHLFSVNYLIVSRDVSRQFDREVLDNIGREVSAFSIDATREADQQTIAVLGNRGMKVVPVEYENFDYVKKATYDLYLDQSPNAWDVLTFIDDLQ